MKTCSVEGCDDKVRCRGMCNKHEKRWRAHGDPLVVHVQERPPCGGVRGYQAHRRRNEDPCGPCTDANTAHMQEYRSDPAVKAREARRNAIQSRALWRLAGKYAADFASFVEMETREQDRREAS